MKIPVSTAENTPVMLFWNLDFAVLENSGEDMVFVRLRDRI